MTVIPKVDWYYSEMTASDYWGTPSFLLHYLAMRQIPYFTIMAITVSVTASALSSTPTQAQNPVIEGSWSVYSDPRGTRIPYPSDVFSVDKGRGESGKGQVLATEDGRAEIHMFSIPNPQRESPTGYLRKHFPSDRSKLTYERVAPNFFAISARRNGVIAYMRCNFSRNAGGTLHCVDLRYPAGEKRAWDRLVTQISLSVRPL